MKCFKCPPIIDTTLRASENLVIHSLLATRSRIFCIMVTKETTMTKTDNKTTRTNKTFPKRKKEIK